MPTVEEYIKERRDMIRQKDQRYVLEVANTIVKGFNEVVEMEIRSNENGNYHYMLPYKFTTTQYVDGVGYPPMSIQYRNLYSNISTKVQELLMESCNGAKFEVFWELEYHKQMTFTVRPFWNEEMIKQQEKIEEALAVAEAAAAP